MNSLEPFSDKQLCHSPAWRLCRGIQLFLLDFPVKRLKDDAMWALEDVGQKEVRYKKNGNFH